ncbi:MAG: hypothetical protein ABIR94_07280 [Rubrivivax sp.]
MVIFKRCVAAILRRLDGLPTRAADVWFHRDLRVENHVKTLAFESTMATVLFVLESSRQRVRRCQGFQAWGGCLRAARLICG